MAKDQDDPGISLRAKILIAGAGALIPIVANLAVVDAALLFQKVTLIAFAGYLTKAVFMFATGCLLGYLNKSETKMTNLLAVGLSVPSLLVGLANGTNYAKLSGENPGSSTLPGGPAAAIFALRTVYASPLPQSMAAQAKAPPAKVFSAPEESGVAQFARGLGIASSNRTYFVIAAAYPSFDDAKAALELVRARYCPGEVYAPPAGSSVYSVVIGENKTLQEANDLQNVAIKAGIPHATVWMFSAKSAPIPAFSIGDCLASAADKFSLDSKNIHQTAFDATFYVYANDVDATLHKTVLYLFNAAAGSFPAGGLVKDLETTGKSLTLRKTEVSDGHSDDSRSPDGKTYRVTVLKTYGVKGAGRADLQACRVL